MYNTIEFCKRGKIFRYDLLDTCIKYKNKLFIHKVFLYLFINVICVCISDHIFEKALFTRFV